MSGYIGNIPVPQATQTRDVFTATSGQTSFATSGYTPGFLDVWLNGVKLVNGTDFTATNGSDVVLSSGATAGDNLEVLSYSTFEVNSQTFTGTTTLTGDLQATTATFSGAVAGTDATFSGGVYVGGTGAANYLDDYEEGSWTPTGNNITLGTSYGYYVKVGKMVTVIAHLQFPSTADGSDAIIYGIPFTADDTILGGQLYKSGGALGYTTHAFTGFAASLYNDNSIVIRSGISNLTNANLSSDIIRFQVTYYAA